MNPASQSSTGKTGLVKVLSLDGGGVHGLSSLLIVEKIMEHINNLPNLTDELKPFQVFDLIGGTGNGGIIAILLGRLRMSIEDSIKAFSYILDEALGVSPGEQKQPLSELSATKLENAIKKIVRENCPEPECVNSRLNAQSNECSHTFEHVNNEPCHETVVLAMPKTDTNTNKLSPPTILATHNMPKDFAGRKIWEVARETSAVDERSDLITSGRHRAQPVDDSFGYSNPCEALIKVAESLFPGRKMVTVSIGAGLGPIVDTDREEPSIKRSLMRMATRSALVHQKLVARYSSPEVYYRFNVEDGITDVTAPVSDKSISAHTSNYCAENFHIFRELADKIQRQGFGSVR